jgi:hypothetical protein
MVPQSFESLLRGGHAHGHPVAMGLPGAGPGAVSRRGFLGRAAGGAGVLLGASLLRPAGAVAAGRAAQNKAPKPIPGGFTINGITFHVTSFGEMPAVITDFEGAVGIADVQGTGRATNPDGSKETLLYDTDMRFFKGVYVAEDGKTRKGTFGFV